MRGKNWLTAATILILVGLCVCVTAYKFFGFDFSGPTKKGADKNAGNVVTNTYDVSKNFQNIDIDADTEDISFVAAKDGKCKVVCVEHPEEPHRVRVEGSTLKIDREPNAKSGFNLVSGKETITVYLPDRKYKDLEVDTDTGDVTVDVSTGKAKLENVTCRNFNSEASTGDLVMKNVIAKDTFTIKRTTGEVSFDGCDAETIYVTTDTGDVTGTLLSDKVFLTETDTGKVDTPKSITGGRCEITTDTGDIRLDVKK